MDWRKWIHETLSSNPFLSAVVPAERMFASGSVLSIPPKPFLVFHVGEETPELTDDGIPVVTSRMASVWVYDEDGSYENVDAILESVKAALIGSVTATDGIACVWEGDSGELADDVYDALTRNTTLRLVGRK